MNMSEFDGVDPDTFDTEALAGASEVEVEIVPLDEPSMEDYGVSDFPTRDAFGAPPVKVVKVRDGVRDTQSR